MSACTKALCDQGVSALKAAVQDFVPDVALVLGSGLGFLGDLCEQAVCVPYDTVPHMRVSTAPGHKGQFVFGLLGGQRVVVMQGRVHYYEGYSFADVVYPIRLMRMMGARKLIATNASGGVRTDWQPGDICLLTDHIKMFDDSPLRGPNPDFLGVRFPDMTYTYTRKLRALAHEAAADLGLSLREAVYMFFPGPQYETPAEIRMARVLGADLVGMSTVPETICARHMGMDVLGFSLLCNMAAGILDQPLTEKEVLDAAEAARPHFSALILGLLERMGG